ncbi:MAG: HPr family phosphocarrier protein [Frankiaceae bacterium]
MAERTVTTPEGVGLHARPAALFAQAAGKAPTDVTIAKPGGTPVNAKSILAVLSLDVRGGEEIVLSADGDEAEEVLDRLAAVISTPEGTHG